MKKCTKCGEQKPLSEFYKNKKLKDGHQAHCKLCSAKYGKEWIKHNWEKRRASNLKYYYGIDFKDFEQLRINQNNCCAICKNPLIDEKHTHLDHSHSSNKIRGILCNHCNRGLGAFKDSLDLLKSAQKYLKKYS